MSEWYSRRYQEYPGIIARLCVLLIISFTQDYSANDNAKFYEDFESIPHGDESNKTAGLCEENIRKNRWAITVRNRQIYLFKKDRTLTNLNFWIWIWNFEFIIIKIDFLDSSSHLLVSSVWPPNVSSEMTFIIHITGNISSLGDPTRWTPDGLQTKIGEVAVE